ncbi:MAG: dephospho-CoA kinase, partial [Candidatus Limnocylindria bacterium]
LDRCDETWVVRCDLDDALARLAARGMDADAVRARLANQTSQESKIAAADVVIDGSVTVAETRRQVELAYEALLARDAG